MSNLWVKHDEQDRCWISEASPADFLAELRRQVESGTIEGEVVEWCSEHGAAIRQTNLCDWGWLNRHVAQKGCRRVRGLVIPVSDGGEDA